MDTYLSAKFTWGTSLASSQAQHLEYDTVTFNTGSHKVTSPLVLQMNRVFRSPTEEDARKLTTHLIQAAEGRLILELESPPFEWWNFMLEFCQRIPAGGVTVLQASRPQCAPTEKEDIVKFVFRRAAYAGPSIIDKLCFLNNNPASEDFCVEAGACFVLLLKSCGIKLSFVLCDIFSIASLVNLYKGDQLSRPFPTGVHQSHLPVFQVLSSSVASSHPVQQLQLAKKIDAKQLKTIFILVPFKLDRGHDRDSHLTAADIPDVTSTVGRLFAEGRLEVTDATLVVWACYPCELAARGDFSEEATRRHLHEELGPHIERLRDLPPIRQVSGSGSSAKSCGVRPFREVKFRMCPYDEWPAGGIAEVPREVWEVILNRTEADSNTIPGATADWEARLGTGETRTAEDS